MEKECKCGICEKWFDPLLINHDSEWWEGYRHMYFCSVECIGKYELEEHMKPLKNKKDESFGINEIEKTVDTLESENVPANFALKILELVALGKIKSNDAKIMSMLMEDPKPSFTVIASRMNLSKQSISRKVDRLKCCLSM